MSYYINKDMVIAYIVSIFASLAKIETTVESFAG